MSDVMEVFYSCPDCGLANAAVKVPRRVDGESVVDWAEMVCTEIAVDHNVRSPKCGISSVTDLRVPLLKLHSPRTKH